MDHMAGDKHAIKQSLNGKEVYWEWEREEEKERDRDLPSQRHSRKTAGVGGACLLKEPLHLSRVGTAPLSGPQGTGSSLHLPG